MSKRRITLVAVTCLLVGIFAGVGGAQILQYKIANSGLATVRDNGRSSSTSPSTMTGTPPAVVSMQLLNENGAVVANKVVTLNAEQSSRSARARTTPGTCRRLIRCREITTRRTGIRKHGDPQFVHDRDAVRLQFRCGGVGGGGTLTPAARCAAPSSGDLSGSAGRCSPGSCCRRASSDPFAACRRQLAAAPDDYESSFCFSDGGPGAPPAGNRPVFEMLMQGQPANYWLPLSSRHRQTDRSHGSALRRASGFQKQKNAAARFSPAATCATFSFQRDGW
jgi:hypothetical protein